MGLTPPGGGDEGLWVGGGGDMHKSDTEHRRAIYCDEAGSVAVLGGECTARGMDIKATMGVGGDKPGWDTTGNGYGSRYGRGG